MPKKNALGKGLDALLKENFSSEQNAALNPENSILNINPALLKANPHQPRKTIDDETIDELAASIKEHGIIQPIVAEKADANGENYFIISGERRTRAAVKLGLKTVPVILRSFDENKKLEIALIENIQREDLNALEEALAYQEIMNLSNINHEELAKRVGKSRSAVTNSLRILKLPEEMREALRANKISAGHARSLLSVVNPADQQVLFGRIIESNLSVRETEAMAADLNAGLGRIAKKEKKVKNESEQNYELRDIEQQFINSLGTKVQIKGNLKKGVVEISYFSKDDLDSLYQKIK